MEHILHVGDSLESDVVGANRAGFTSVLLDRLKAKSGEHKKEKQKQQNRVALSSNPEGKPVKSVFGVSKLSDLGPNLVITCLDELCSKL